MAKIPNLVQQPVGEFALGNIPTPDYMGPSRAFADLLDTIEDVETVGGIDEATGEAAKELSELRAILVNSNTLEADFVGEGYDVEQHMSVSDGKGGRIELPKPVIFTHEVANDIWEKRSEEIVSHYAGQITNADARSKFLKEVNQRYVAPGGAEVMGSNIIRARAYGQARAERAIENIISSNAPSEERESEAKSVIARQALLGADPVWVERRLAELGPAIDQMDVHNSILDATSIDQVDIIEERMWVGGTRMDPAQLRTMSGIMDARRRDFKQADDERQERNSDDMFAEYHSDAGLNTERVDAAVQAQDITQSDGWRFKNAAGGDSATKASDQWTLSRYKGEIARLQFVGGGAADLRLLDKAKLLKLIIINGSMGLTANGVPTGLPPQISGVDALTLNKEIDLAVKAALDNQEYKDALGSLMLWTRSKYDLEGQVVSRFGGNQNQIEAAIAFKTALDNYMNAFGVDAKPTEFVEKNKDAYDPRHFTNGINARFLEVVPQALPYMTMDKKEAIFTRDNQQNFALWLGDNAGSLGPEKYEDINQLYKQFYEGWGVPPSDGKLMLEPDDPLYRQFQSMIPDPD